MKQAKIAIIGGSGLYEMEGMKIHEEREVSTPFGQASDHFILGELEGVPVAFLPRHSRGHKILPSEINYPANIYAIKKLGCEFIVSVSAVGSLREEIQPGHLVMIDQFIDRTKDRATTFFGNGIVAHVAFAEPICEILRGHLHQAALEAGAKSHNGGTYVCIEGPMFSSKAESKMFRSWDAQVIGMTNYQEARLAREAELSYATMALSTDYDCWHPEHDSVTADMVIATLNQNIEMAKKVLRLAIPKIAKEEKRPFADCLKNAIVTNKLFIPDETKQKLEIIIGKYL